jgi:pyruvate formate-lyase/glycerol dehydratase family glycyl radical enzyme
LLNRQPTRLAMAGLVLAGVNQMALRKTETGDYRRIEEIRADLFKERYSICLERPELLNRYWRSGSEQGKHPYLRRAEALAYIYSNRKPKIYRNELIVGNISSKRIAANYYPEGGSIHILEDLFCLGSRPVLPLYLERSEKIKLLALALRNFTRSVATRALCKPGWFGYFLDFFRAKRYYITEEAGISHLVPGHEGVIKDGLRRSRELAINKLEAGNLNSESEAFYKGVCIVIDGIRQMAANLAAETERQAADMQGNSERRLELLEIAESCRWVPYEPARNFREGIQATWLIHLALNLEDFEQGISFGRLDQFLYPLYLKDLQSGMLTEESARELLACLCLKCGETIPLYSRRINRFFGGNAVGQGMTIGGVDFSGNDVTNDLSRLVLEAYNLVMTREPSLHARIHDRSPEWFLDSCTELIQAGSGRPALFGDEAVIKALENAGFTKEHARDYAVIGCVEMGSQGRTYNSSDAALFNLPLCLELALNRGRRFKGGGRLGALTSAPDEIGTYDQLLEAFRLQVEDAVSDLVKVINELEKAYRQIRPSPLNSILTEGCLDRGQDVTWGGALYDFTSIQGVGLADAGESLYVLKKLVFETKEFSLAEFAAILNNNFKDHEQLRIRLQNRLSRFGNDNPEVDAAVQMTADIFAEAITRQQNSRGGKYITGFYSMTCHHGFGSVTGALPNGRKAGFRLSNGLSPADGADRKGPTALLNSAAQLDNSKWANCYALNLKFEKSMISGPKGHETLKDLIRGYFKQGGMELQINVQDTNILRLAKENPTAYPGLMVRVSGYCSYFCDLSPEVQDEIIERTAFGK